jgi:hypothetical protein
MKRLSDYPLEHQICLKAAKSNFLVSSFSIGLFWPHKHSRLRAAYDELGLEALSRAKASTSKGEFIYIDKGIDSDDISGLELNFDSGPKHIVFFSFSKPFYRR